MDILVLMTAAYLGFLSLGVLLFGVFGRLQPPLLVCFLFFSALFYLAGWHLLVRMRKEEFKALAPFAYLRMPLYFLFAIAGAASLLSPPVFDELSYHLSLPFRFLAGGAIGSIPYNIYSNFPLNQEMLYLFGEFFQGLYLSRFINIFMGIGCALALIAIARRHFEYEGGLIGNLIFFSMFSVGTLLPFAYNDFGLAFYSLVSLLCFFNWQEEKKPLWLAAAGAFSGLALGTKYLGGFGFLAIFILVITVDVINKTDRRQIFLNLILFCFPALILFSPWLIKNWIMTGNPVYPFLYPVFGGRGWSSLNDHRYFDLLRNLYGPSGAGWRRFLNLPGHLLLDFKGDVPLGLALLLLLSSLFFWRRTDFKTKLLGGYSLLFFIFWTLGSLVNRFLMPGLAAASLLAGILIARSKVRWFHDASIIILVVVLFVNISLISSLPHTLGNSFAEAQDLVAMSTACNLLVNKQEKLLFIGEVRTYGFKCRLLAPTMFDSNYLEPILARSRTREEFTAQLKKEGIAYLLYNNERLRWLQADFRYFHDAFLLKKFLIYLNSPQFRPVFSYGGLVLFRLEPPPRQPQDRQST